MQMSIQDLSRVALLTACAFFCMSGQAVRREMTNDPTTQLEKEAIEAKEQWVAEAPRIAEEPKSAAKRAMEEVPGAPKSRKSAARKAMELEGDFSE